MEKQRIFQYDESVDKMPPEQRKKYLEEKLTQVIQYAYQNAPAVKARFDQAGIDPSEIHSIQDLERIPILRKDELVELQKINPPFGGFLAVPIEELERIYQSPGPIYDPQRRRTWGAEVFQAMGFRKGDIVLNTWAYHLVPAGLGIDEGLRSVGATVIPAGTGNTELQVRIMHDLKVTGFCGTTGFLMNIIKKAEELGYDFKKDFSLRLANAGGEMGGGPMREIFEKEYGITTRDAYGTADLGLIAYECSEKTGMHLVGDAIVEIVDPKTGKQLGPNEVGEVVVTPFDEVYPLIRFSTGDLSAYADEPCPCGRTSPRLLKIMGRVGDAVRVRGMFVHPKQTDEVISRFPEISRYQVVVTRPEFRDEMVFKIELADENIDKEKLQSALDTSIRDVCKVRADRIEFVAKGTIPEERKAIVDERVY